MASGNEPKAQQGIRLTSRDAQILEALYGVGYLTTHQICALFFTAGPQATMGATKACERRMRLLHGVGLVRRIEQPVRRHEGSKAFIYALSKLGADFLIAEIGIDPAEIDWRPQSFEANTPFLNHLLMTTDLRITLVKACQQTGVELVEWIDERALRAGKMIDYVTLTDPQGQKITTAVVPDAVFVLEQNGKRALFLLEIDLRNVPVEPRLFERKGWAKKVRTYALYVETQAFFARYEGRRARVLTVTTSQKRLTALRNATERTINENHQLFWFTTFEGALDPTKLLTDPIWAVAMNPDRRSLLK